MPLLDEHANDLDDEDDGLELYYEICDVMQREINMTDEERAMRDAAFEEFDYDEWLKENEVEEEEDDLEKCESVADDLEECGSVADDVVIVDETAMGLEDMPIGDEDVTMEEKEEESETADDGMRQVTETKSPEDEVLGPSDNVVESTAKKKIGILLLDETGELKKMRFCSKKFNIAVWDPGGC